MGRPGRNMQGAVLLAVPMALGIALQSPKCRDRGLKSLFSSFLGSACQYWSVIEEGPAAKWRGFLPKIGETESEECVLDPTPRLRGVCVCRRQRESS